MGYAVHGSHPTDLDNLRKASAGIHRAVDRHILLFNSSRLLEVQNAPDPDYNGLYDEQHIPPSEEHIGRFFGRDGAALVVLRIGSCIMGNLILQAPESTKCSFSAYSTKETTFENGVWVPFTYIKCSQRIRNRHNHPM